MNRRLDTHATAFGLAAMITLAMLSSMNLLATQPHDSARATTSAPRDLWGQG